MFRPFYNLKRNENQNNDELSNYFSSESRIQKLTNVATFGRVTSFDIDNLTCYAEIFPKEEDDQDQEVCCAVPSSFIQKFYYKDGDFLIEDNDASLSSVDYDTGKGINLYSTPSLRSLEAGSIVFIVFTDKDFRTNLNSQLGGDVSIESLPSNDNLHSRTFGVVVSLVNPAPTFDEALFMNRLAKMYRDIASVNLKNGENQDSD